MLMVIAIPSWYHHITGCRNTKTIEELWIIVNFHIAFCICGLKPALDVISG
jgi:hypothetical protein